MDKEAKATKQHDVILKNREALTVFAVNEITSFDEHCVMLDIGDFTLTAEGSELSITAFSRESSTAEISGQVDSLYYSDNTHSSNAQRAYKRGLLKRMFLSEAE